MKSQPTSGKLHKQQRQVAAIQRRQWQQVHHRQVDVHDGGELEQAADVSARHLSADRHDGDRAGDLLCGGLEVEYQLLQTCIAGSDHDQSPRTRPSSKYYAIKTHDTGDRDILTVQ